MSKVTFEETWLGGASSGKFFADALAIAPLVASKRAPSKIDGKLIYVYGNCPEHKQVKTAARKNEKLVQDIAFTQEEH